VRVDYLDRNSRGSGERIPANQENLAARAISLLMDRVGLEKTGQTGAEIDIVKGIPSQAGLGGGSSDAAAALLLGNAVWNTGLNFQDLARWAAELGSDVPFFLQRSVALCTGRGERIAPVECRQAPCFVIAKPPMGHPTAEVYANVSVPAPSERRDHAEIIAALRQASMSQWTHLLFNRLQPAANGLNEWGKRLCQAFRATDCLATQVCGSGSAWFGVYRNRRVAMTSLKQLRARIPELQLFCCRGLTAFSPSGQFLVSRSGVA